MAFAGHCGVSLNVDMLVTEGDGIADSRAEVGDSKNWAGQVGERRNELTLKALFNEELGVVIQVPSAERDAVMAVLREHGLSKHAHVVGKPNDRGVVEVWRDAKAVFTPPLQRAAPALGRGQLAHRAPARQPGLRRRRARRRRAARTIPGLHLRLSFDPPAGAEACKAPPCTRTRPKLAILREQGVNSQVEMSYAMAQAGFDTFDVHMTDLQAGRARLDQFMGFVACGGFSYGDTLGAGEGWARSILFNPALAEQFAAFFSRTDTFALGVCNGCQMMAALSPLIPGASAWPKFTRNRSEQFEARLSLVEVLAARSCSSPAWRAAASRSRSRMARAMPISRSAATPTAVQRAMRFVDHQRPGRPRPTPPTPTAAPAA